MSLSQKKTKKKAVAAPIVAQNLHFIHSHAKTEKNLSEIESLQCRNPLPHAYNQSLQPVRAPHVPTISTWSRGPRIGRTCINTGIPPIPL